MAWSPSITSRTLENLRMRNAHACYPQEKKLMADDMYGHPREGALDHGNGAVLEKTPQMF